MKTCTEETTAETRLTVTCAAKLIEQGQSTLVSSLTTDPNVFAIGQPVKETIFQKINAVDLRQAQTQDQTILDLTLNRLLVMCLVNR